ncbi:hypothetical protein C3Y08_01730 [Burkholderia gladioli]|uniref:hypothetical protein n=1 Tax=Burkholderia gladioli TaxID=28095 RepID=UPI000CDAD29C|nr:hypothetical protein [Burkholderia gladioli]POS10192.1 hypothetical protein C3Y08_01730 [Burkholderia gladioli]
MNDLVASPFGGRSTAVADTAGARQDQSRELAETQVKYLMAQQFPRDVIANTDKILNAFTRPTLAEQSQYQFSRGGSDISGPSIRAAEAMAQQWGNIEQGFRERSRGVDGKGIPFSEVEAFCVDLESRTTKRLQFIVRHWRDTRQGGYQIKDERDIYELIANQAQRRVRACILALIPGDVVDAAMQQAEVTLKAKADTSPEAVQKIISAFTDHFGVTKEHIEKRIQRRLDAITPAQVVSLRRIYASLRDGMSGPDEWFDMGEQPATAGETTNLKDIAAARKSSKPKQEPKAPESPSVDSILAQIEKCADVDTLDACLDGFREYPADVLARLTEAYNRRRETLLGA